MNRDTLQKFGLSDEQVNQVMAEHGKDLEKSKTVESELEQVKQQNSELTSQIADRDKQLKDLSGKAGDNEELQSQIKALQEQNKQSKTDYEANIATLKRDGAIELALREAQAKNPKAVKALLNGDIISVDDSGVHGLKEQLEQLKESDSYLFNIEPEPKPGLKITTSGNPGGGVNAEKNIADMSLEEMTAEYQKNPALFG
ncbi:phage scaffolding protein [Leuconostoc citreum]